MAFGRMGSLGRGFGRLGAHLGSAAGSGVTPPTAPVLSLDSEIAGLISLIWAIDSTVSTGDTLTRQVASDVGFSTVLETDPHVITSDENTADQITSSQYQAPANGTYYIRGRVTRASDSAVSAWSDPPLTVVVSDMATSSYIQLEGSTDRIQLEGTTDLILLEA